MWSASLTLKQKEVYNYIKDHIRENNHSPYIREIQQACGFNSHKSVIDKLLVLERKGYIKRHLNKHRGIILKHIEEQPQEISVRGNI